VVLSLCEGSKMKIQKGGASSSDNIKQYLRMRKILSARAVARLSHCTFDRFGCTYTAEGNSRPYGTK
jgi:hypothetical protein